MEEERGGIDFDGSSVGKKAFSPMTPLEPP
jgi:hypothetical protein